MIKEELKNTNKNPVHYRHTDAISELEKTLINSPNSETARFELIVQIARTVNNTLKS